MANTAWRSTPESRDKKLRELSENLEDARKKLSRHRKEVDIVIGINVLFFLLMLTSIVGGFLFNLGYGIIGANMVFIVFFVITCVISIMKVWPDEGPFGDSRSTELKEKVEHAERRMNNYLTDVYTQDHDSNG